MIRRMRSSDISDVVRIHLASFPKFFLSCLGDRFLTSYYDGVCSGDDSICRVYQDPCGEILGFVVGARWPSGFYRRLYRKRWIHFSVALMGAVLERPSIIGRLVHAARCSTQREGDDRQIAGLFSIAVHPKCQGSGFGQGLVASFCEAAMELGCVRVMLTTDGCQNDRANAFYCRMGFNLEGTFVASAGRRMNRYVKDI
jgi:ribosomal protein S18 acetylase RimI-like enzyme